MQLQGGGYGLFVDKGRIAAEDKGISPVSLFKITGCLHYGMACAQAFFLLYGGDAGFAVTSTKIFVYVLSLIALDDAYVVYSRIFAGTYYPFKHRLPKDAAQDFGLFAFHTLALSAGKYYNIICHFMTSRWLV